MIVTIDVDADHDGEGYVDCSSVQIDGSAPSGDLEKVEALGFEFERWNGPGSTWIARNFDGPCPYPLHWTEAAERALRAAGFEVRT